MKTSPMKVNSIIAVPKPMLKKAEGSMGKGARRLNKSSWNVYEEMHTPRNVLPATVSPVSSDAIPNPWNSGEIDKCASCSLRNQPTEGWIMSL